MQACRTWIQDRSRRRLGPRTSQCVADSFGAEIWSHAGAKYRQRFYVSWGESLHSTHFSAFTHTLTSDMVQVKETQGCVKHPQYSSHGIDWEDWQQNTRLLPVWLYHTFTYCICLYVCVFPQGLLARWLEHVNQSTNVIDCLSGEWLQACPF